MLTLSNEKDKIPLTPGADGKIHAKWYEDGNIAPRTKSFHVPDDFKPQLKRIR